MKKRQKTLIILAVVLVAVIAAYMILSNLTAVPEEESDAYTLLKVDKTDIAEISFVYDGERIDLYQDTETETWYLADDPEFPLDNYKATLMCGCISSVTTDTKADNNGDTEAYGLDNPILEVTAVMVDGSEFSVEYGALNSFNDMYYATCSVDEEVYMLPSRYVRYYSYHLNDLAEPDTIPSVRSSLINKVVLTADGQNMEIVRCEDGEYYTDEYSFLTTSSDGETVGADEDIAGIMASAIATLTTDSCYKYNADEQDMLDSGLDGSNMITVSYTMDGEQKSYTLLIGDRVETGEDTAERYVMLEGSNMICMADATTLDWLLTLTPESLRATEVCPLSASELLSLDITVGDKKWDFDIEWKGVHTADYYLDGNEIEGDTFKSMLSTITTLKSTGSGEVIDGEVVLTAAFVRDRDEFGEMTLTLYTYSDEYYRAEFNDVATQLVLISDVDKILASLENIK